MSSNSSYILSCQDLSKSVQGPLGEISILRRVNLDIGHGDTVAISGASGSGKSTLLGLLAGLDTPSGGQISLCGHEISFLDENQRAVVRRGNVGFVFQSFHLLNNLSALENVKLPLELAGDRQRSAKIIEAMATAALKQVGLAERLQHYPSVLSGGEQQRVAIARAFVSEPVLLFADEPTGNLDDRTGQEIVDLLFDLNANFQTTLVLVTHDVTLAQRCRHRFRLHDGELQGFCQ